jgi:hypothetical protein
MYQALQRYERKREKKRQPNIHLLLPFEDDLLASRKRLSQANYLAEMNEIPKRGEIVNWVLIRKIRGLGPKLPVTRWNELAQLMGNFVLVQASY